MELNGDLVVLAKQAVDMVLHVDHYLAQLVAALGPGLYWVLFAIIFCETGLVITPFLPGDSLLFAAGALAALPGSPINVGFLWALLLVAGILGDGVNYHIGKFIGPKVFRAKDSFFLRQKHLHYAQNFYEKHGGKTIILARFVPIVRTFAPFVAGIGTMKYSRFLGFNIVGALAWVSLFLLSGFFLGNIPAVQQRFHIIIIAILVLSVLPGVFEIMRARALAVKSTQT